MKVLLVGPLAAAVFRGPGDPPTPAPSIASTSDLIVAVDSGYDRCLERGWVADVLVGDLDSLSDHGRATSAEQGVETVELPVDKEVSDLQVALENVVGRGASSIVGIGFLGGRLDHQLAVLGACARVRADQLVLLGPGVDAGQDVTGDVVHVVHAGSRVAVERDHTFSVFALLGGAVVSVDGARWPLQRRSLQPISTLGLSNESGSSGAYVTSHDGVAAVVIPR